MKPRNVSISNLEINFLWLGLYKTQNKRAVFLVCIINLESLDRYKIEFDQ